MLRHSHRLRMGVNDKVIVITIIAHLNEPSHWTVAELDPDHHVAAGAQTESTANDLHVPLELACSYQDSSRVLPHLDTDLSLPLLFVS
jgi:hypothetical protein